AADARAASVRHRHPARRDRRGAAAARSGILPCGRAARAARPVRPRPRDVRRRGRVPAPGLGRVRAAVGPVRADVVATPGTGFAMSEPEHREASGQPLWAGRFGEGPSDELLAFTVSLPYDRRLAGDDLAGSRAHVNMLERV